MNLRFSVDQAEAFRRGIDCPKSIVTVEVNPKDLSQADRDLIAARMDGIDICQLGESRQKLFARFDGGDKVRHVEAATPTFEDLMIAIRANEAAIQKSETLRREDLDPGSLLGEAGPMSPLDTAIWTKAQ